MAARRAGGKAQGKGRKLLQFMPEEFHEEVEEDSGDSAGADNWWLGTQGASVNALMGNPFQALAEQDQEEETHEGHACYALVRDNGPDKATKFVGTVAGGRMKGPTKDGYWVDAVAGTTRLRTGPASPTWGSYGSTSGPRRGTSVGCRSRLPPWSVPWWPCPSWPQPATR